MYCGVLATDRDHLVARSIVRPHFLSKTVPCCRECNRTLGSVALFTVRERACFLIDKYARKDISIERLQWLRAVALMD
jgi:hypothetical protein